MTIKRIACHLLADDLLIRFQQVEITLTRFRRNFESDVEQLTNICIEVRIAGNVPEGLRAAPCHNDRQFRVFDFGVSW